MPWYSRLVSHPAIGALNTYAKCKMACANTEPSAIAPTKLLTKTLLNRSSMFPPNQSASVSRENAKRSHAVNPPGQKPCCQRANDCAVHKIGGCDQHQTVSNRWRWRHVWDIPDSNSGEHECTEVVSWVP